MRQQRWLELVRDYDCAINYHPGKANVVDDALSRKSSSSILMMKMVQRALLVELMKLEIYIVSTDGVITFHGRLCVPKIGDLREEILMEAHRTPYSVHSGATKMYKDLKMY